MITNITRTENATIVEAESLHLTSFAVLVDVAGGQEVPVACHVSRHWQVLIPLNRVHNYRMYLMQRRWHCKLSPTLVALYPSSAL